MNLYRQHLLKSLEWNQNKINSAQSASPKTLSITEEEEKNLFVTDPSATLKFHAFERTTVSKIIAPTVSSQQWDANEGNRMRRSEFCVTEDSTTGRTVAAKWRFIGGARCSTGHAKSWCLVAAQTAEAIRRYGKKYHVSLSWASSVITFVCRSARTTITQGTVGRK